MGLMSIRLGTADVAKAGAFYDATFQALGYADSRIAGMGAAIALYRLPGGVHFVLGAPADGRPPTHGNGDTFGFSAPDHAAVDRWHAAGLSAGGTSEGEPGLRPAAGDRYGAYLRDPDGHKICAYATG